MTVLGESLNQAEAREENPYVATHGLVVQPPTEARETSTQPLTVMQAGILLGLRSEVGLLAKNLKIPQFVERCEQEIKGGISGSELGARVSGSRTPKQPQHDRNDREFIDHRDDYTSALRRAIKALRECGKIEQKVLLPVGEADEFVAAIVSDLPSCSVCSGVKKAKKPWRLRAGRCIACYQYWIDHGRVEDRPKELWAR